MKWIIKKRQQFLIGFDYYKVMEEKNYPNNFREGYFFLMMDNILRNEA